ncbi:hypothetical protein GCM10009838_01160 [Catenulispora subtropica]|uniref:Serine protease n=2 Tax=Catenulispora subtropica TaxID=450798 RepID=A0ABN2QD09_9ACTN
MGLAGAVALLGGLGVATGVTASAAPAAHTHHRTAHPHGRFGVVPMHSGTAATKTHRAPAAAGNLIYNGGPVQHNVSVYLIFWGSQWDSDGNGVQSYMQNLFGGLGTGSDTWSTVTSQYTDNSGSGPSFNGAVLAGSWVDDSGAAPQAASQQDIANEAENGVQHFGINGGTDVQMVVLSPSGTNPDNFPNAGFCAWHDWDGNVSYTNMPYVLDAGNGCGAGSVQSQLDGFSIVEGHEYAESLTDPQPSSGWVASDGEENGDLCAWQNLGTINLPTGTFAMQPTWSNAAGGCAMSS